MMKKTISVDKMIEYLAIVWALKEDAFKKGEDNLYNMEFNTFIDVESAMLYCLDDTPEEQAKIEHAIDKKVREYYLDHYAGLEI